MYLKYFSLTAKPFAMNPDPSFLYESEQHAAASTMLEYAIESQASFSMLTGEIGSGKTTLIRRLIRGLGEQVTVGLVSNTHQRFVSIVPWVLSGLGITARDSSEVQQYEALNDFLIREYGERRRTLLIFDEAQNLSIGALEELRLLSNINSESDVALQILLVGQPELRVTINRPELKQFAQRVAVDFHLGPLSVEDVRAYIRHRLKIAGCTENIFESKAIEFIHYISRGIPRLINQMCDLALVYAYADQRARVSGDIVAKVYIDRMKARTPLHGDADPRSPARIAAKIEARSPPGAIDKPAHERA